MSGRLAQLSPTDIGVPGPTALDMARAFRSVRADPLGFLTSARERYGDTVAFPVPGPPALLLADPADARHVLQTSARTWGKHTVQYVALARVTGPGLLASWETSWIDHRRIAAPAFHHQRLAAIGEQVRAAADDAVAAWTGPGGPVGRGAVVDVAPLVHGIALDAVGRALFSTDLSGAAQELLTASSRAARLVVRAGRAVVPAPTWVPTPLNVQLAATRRRMDGVTARLVAERRRRAGGGTNGDDLLGLLLDSGLPDQQVRDELVTMVIAGHETVAAALSWALMLLAEDQPAQDRVRAELAALPGPAPFAGSREAVPFTRAVVDETLRLYPPAWALSRRAQAEDVLAGRPVPAGTLAIISPWLLHRDERTWPDPLAFRPERFLGAGSAPAGYLPFGQGPRLCIGRELALGEMVVVLDRLIGSCRVEAPDGWVRPVPEALAAVHPHGGMPLRVTPIDGRAG